MELVTGPTSRAGGAWLGVVPLFCVGLPEDRTLLGDLDFPVHVT